MTDKIKELSMFLYEIDPGETCCKENESLDEYDIIAEELIGCEDIKEYLTSVFDESLDQTKLEQIYGKVQNICK
jgi:hypothetical protein